ncbi:short-chain dehydrogenase [Tenacibaculum holothuriorum]|uniref:Short-chain dehydrogenase n=1 Tax=Tenacibaculum holothuriorum TaxID=1635173 RepID=A0A1Y2P901_9FLAO|nr:SDR family oxidoreductase [Tenacibaculum holothuriorum]OSY86925.1 short-chain dehydrogenase [Tenacibaculum holothuriorum]
MKNLALITGASSGIGEELAHIHAEKGNDLIIVARRQDKLEALKATLEIKYDVNVVIIIKDLSKPNAAKELFNEVVAMNLEVEYLINNAGFGLRGKFHKLPWERQQQMINLNMVSLTELMYLFLPQMVQRNSGKILNTSSTASFMPGPLQAIYFASKVYVTYLSNAIAEELSDTNITITNLMPGATETEFAKTADMERTGLFEKAVSARSVAEDGYNGMLSGKLDVVSGLTFSQKLMMKAIPFTPKKVMLKQIKQMQTAN